MVGSTEGAAQLQPQDSQELLERWKNPAGPQETQVEQVW